MSNLSPLASVREHRARRKRPALPAHHIDHADNEIDHADDELHSDSEASSAVDTNETTPETTPGASDAGDEGVSDAVKLRAIKEEFGEWDHLTENGEEERLLVDCMGSLFR
jgi:hypothetical protein